MELVGSQISCGLYELDQVGQNPTDKEYEEAMSPCECAIVIASVPARWTRAIKFLKRKGFKQTLRQNKNPNSGNKIVLLAKNITKKDREHFRALYKQRRDEWHYSQ